MPNDAIDTTGTIEIAQSASKMLVLVLAGVAMTAASAFLAFGPVAQDAGSFMVFIGWIGMVLFGACLVLILWRGLTSKGPTLTISPRGLRDARVSRDFIPWAAIHRLSTWSYQGQNILVVAIDPEVEARIGLTAIARWSRAPNRALGADGLAVTAQGLQIGHDRLFELVRAYTEAYQRRH